MPEMSDAAMRLKYPVWVRSWRSIHLGWLAVVVVLLAALTALIVVAVLLLPSVHPGVLIGFLWCGFLMFALLGLAVVLSGAGSVRLSRFMQPVEVAGVGGGLSVPGRGDFLIRSLIFVVAVTAGVSYLAWKDDEPGRRQINAEIATLIGAPAFLLYFVLGFVIVNRTRISLHPEGIVQEIYRRRGWKVTTAVTVVPWDEIIDLHAQTHPNPAVSHPHWYPTLRVVYRGADNESDQVLVLMACEKKVEPNSLLALVKWCRDNPWAREQLAHDDARELLRPPSLLERIRADLAASSGRADVPR